MNTVDSERHAPDLDNVIECYDDLAEAEAAVGVWASLGWSVVYAEPDQGRTWISYRRGISDAQ